MFPSSSRSDFGIAARNAAICIAPSILVAPPAAAVMAVTLPLPTRERPARCASISSSLAAAAATAAATAAADGGRQREEVKRIQALQAQVGRVC